MMSDPFTKLKDAMSKTLFKDFSFSDDQKQAVKETVRSQHSKPQLHMWKEETLLNVLASIQQEPKSGFEISTHLFQVNDSSFKNNEGQLYSLLHLLETKGILLSSWREENNNQVKRYSLTSRGQRLLHSQKQESHHKRASLKHLLEEASL